MSRSAVRSALALIFVCSSLGVGAADAGPTASAIVERTNAFREEHGLAAVVRNATLDRAAQGFARYMARTGRYGHTADGRQPSARAADEGYEYCIITENIGYQYRSTGFDVGELAGAFTDGWKRSPNHRKNMLDEAVTHTGVGVAQAEDGRYFGVQMFGLPKRAAIRFEVYNRSGEHIAYRVGEREFSLRERELRTHLMCRPARLAIALPSPKAPFATALEHGTRYIILEDRIDMRPLSDR